MNASLHQKNEKFALSICKTEGDIDKWVIDVKRQPINTGKMWEGNVIYGELLKPPEEHSGF